MRRDYQKGKVFAIGREVYIGIDVHKETWHITARVKGEEVFHGNMLSDYQCLRKFLERCGRRPKGTDFIGVGSFLQQLKTQYAAEHLASGQAVSLDKGSYQSHYS